MIKTHGKRLLTHLFFLIVLGLFSFVTFFSPQSKAQSASDPHALITYFDITPATLGETNATLTLKFQLKKADFSSGGTSYLELILNRGSGDSYNISGATGSLEYIKFTSDDSPVSTGDLEVNIDEIMGGLRFNFPNVATDIPQDSEVEIQVSGVTLPSTAGAYAMRLEARDNTNEYFYASASTDQANNTFAFLGTPCAKVKVTNPAGDTVARQAYVYIHSFDWMTMSECTTDYYGLCAVYADNWSNRSTCPTGSFLIDAQPSATDEDTYARVNNQAISLPDQATTYTGDNPIKLGSIQVTGTLTDGALNDGTKVAYGEVSLRPETFGGPSDFKSTQSDANGGFNLGGLTAGVYVMEFRMPWDANNLTSITAPDPITGVEVNDSNQIKIPNYCDSFVDVCNMGNVSYPEAVKTISGTIKDESGNSMTAGWVSAMQEMGMSYKQSQISEDGTYSILTGGGTWNLMPQPNNNPDSEVWTYCGMPKFVSFASDDTVETKTANFTVKRATVTVTGTVKKPNGDPFYEGDVQVRSKDGCGSWRSLESNGSFSLKVPPGTYTLTVGNWGSDSALGSPSSETITVNSTNSPYNVGTLTMIEKKDTITGRIWADNNSNGQYDSGEGRGSVRVEAFKMSKKFDEFGPGMGGPGDGGFVSASTNDSGAYSLKVTPGTWMVNVMLDPAMMGGYSSNTANYIYTGAPQQVNVTTSENGNTYSGNNFEVQLADATIEGVIVDEDGNSVSGVYGFAFADSGTGPMMGMGMGAPIQNSTFTIKVPAGTYNVGVDFPPDSAGYTSAGSKSVTAVSGETVTAQMTVKPNNKRIQVNLVDTSGDPITNVSMMDLFAESSTGAHVFKMLYGGDLSSGSTTLNVCEGTWDIGYFVSPSENNYMSEPISKDNKVTVTSAHTSGNPAQVNITLREANSTISGTVTDPSGNPVSGAWISTDNRKTSGFDIAGPMFMMGETTDDSGSYSITLPEGTYKVQAFLPSSMGYINPEAVEVTTSPSSPASANLQFGQSNATITGTVTLDGSPKGAFITAYSEKGGYSEVNTTTGSYSLNVTQNDTWYVRAMYESGENFYRSPLQKVEMGSSSTKSQDLALSKASFTIPTSVSATFDYQNAKRISLSNGFVLSIPAGAISPSSNASGNNITVTVSPTAQLSNQNQAMPVGVGYDITAIDDSGTTLTSTFNSAVTITIPYTDEYLNDILGSADESLLDNAYWDDSTSAWRNISGATIDTTNNTISFTVNHFTTFSVLTGTDPSTSTTGSSDSSTTSSGASSSDTSSTPDVKSADGKVLEKQNQEVMFMIPANALEWDANIDVRQMAQGEYQKPSPPLWIVSGPYQTSMKTWWNDVAFSNFLKPVSLIVRYDPNALGEIPERSLRLNWWDESLGRWRPLSSLLITDRHEVATVITDLKSKYALIGGFGYQGASTTYDTEQTVTATVESDDIGMNEEITPKREITQEPVNTSQDLVPQPKTESRPGFFTRIWNWIKNIF